MAPSTAHHRALNGAPPCGGGATPLVSGTAARELQQSLSPASVVLCSPLRHISSPSSSDISSANPSSGSPIPWYESVSHWESSSEPCTVGQRKPPTGPRHLRCTGRISLFAHLQGPRFHYTVPHAGPMRPLAPMSNTEFTRKRTKRSNIRTFVSVRHPRALA